MPIERAGEIDRGGARTDNPDLKPSLATPNASIDVTKVPLQTPHIIPEDPRTPIGVPKGYGATYGEGGNIFDIDKIGATHPPRYFIGDELIPANYPVERRRQMQQDLFEAGLLDAGYRKDEWDIETQNAYKSALARANASGTTYDQTIQELKANVAAYGRPTDQRQIAPGVIELTNPSQIANLANEVAVRVMGRKLDPDQADRFAQTYNQMEREYQQQVYNLRVQGSPNTVAGEVVQPKSLSDFGTDIAAQVKEENPQDTAVVSTLNAADIFFNMLKAAHI